MRASSSATTAVGARRTTATCWSTRSRSTGSTTAANYKEVITLAVDADEADGRAFVTEYAGPSDVVTDVGLFSPNWNAVPFTAIDPVGVIDELTGQGL